MKAETYQQKLDDAMDDLFRLDLAIKALDLVPLKTHEARQARETLKNTQLQLKAARERYARFINAHAAPVSR